MVRKIKAKAILRLNDQGLSGRAIARSLGIARQSVAEVLAASAAAGIAYPDVETKPDDEVYSMLFPGRGERESVYEQPDWARVHRELARVGVTLRILHGEYADECAAAGRPRMGYDRFCKQYAAYVARTGVTSRVEHKAGRTIEVDWAGKTMRIVDPVTGDVSKAYLFVAVLPFSRYAFVEPTLDMGQNAWLRCHVAMYEWFGGSTPRLVCDNLKTGVISHPRDGEVVLNDAYRSMAEHYSAAVIPGRVRRPKDKPSAENTVWHATMALAGAMRDRAFASLDELRGAVRGWLDEYNSRPFQKRDGSRRSVFESDERPLLIPLPGTAYEVADWIYGRKVQSNCHVAYARNWYWDRERCERWAKRVGPDCADVVGRLFAAQRFDDQGVEPALAVLRLSRRYSERRLENACSLALQSVASPRYSHIRPILETGQDMTGGLTETSDDGAGGWVRGGDYYANMGR